MRFIVKKSTDLLEDEKKMICNLFHEVFGKIKTLEQFNLQFTKTFCNYSYHGLMMKDSEIVGCYSSIPFMYNYFGENYIFSLSVDTMIKEEHRGNPFVFKKLAKSVYDFMAKDGVAFVFGFPNDNIYLVRKKILKWKDIGMLNFYILPTSTISNRFSFFNPVIKLIIQLYLKIVKNIFISSNVEDKNIYKLLVSDKWKFEDYRYNKKEYQSINLNESNLHYIVVDEDGKSVCYIIDINIFNKIDADKLFINFINEVIDKVDMILFVSNINLYTKFMIKVPKKYEPKNVYVSGMILDETKIDSRIFNLNNWNLNISNYDVR